MFLLLTTRLMPAGSLLPLLNYNKLWDFLSLLLSFLSQNSCFQNPIHNRLSFNASLLPFEFDFHCHIILTELNWPLAWWLYRVCVMFHLAKSLIKRLQRLAVHQNIGRASGGCHIPNINNINILEKQKWTQINNFAWFKQKRKQTTINKKGR